MAHVEPAGACRCATTPCADSEPFARGSPARRVGGRIHAAGKSVLMLTLDIRDKTYWIVLDTLFRLPDQIIEAMPVVEAGAES